MQLAVGDIEVERLTLTSAHLEDPALHTPSRRWSSPTTPSYLTFDAKWAELAQPALTLLMVCCLRVFRGHLLWNSELKMCACRRYYESDLAFVTNADIQVIHHGMWYNTRVSIRAYLC